MTTQAKILAIKNVINDAIATRAQELANKELSENVKASIDLINDINNGKKKIVFQRGDEKKLSTKSLIEFFPDVKKKIKPAGTWTIADNLKKKFNRDLLNLELSLVLTDNTAVHAALQKLLDKIANAN